MDTAIVRLMDSESADRSDELVRTLEDLPSDEDNDWVSHPRRYRFPSLNNCDVFLHVPDDLTRREGNRLAASIKSLPYYNP